MRYDYYENVKEDVKNWVKENYNNIEEVNRDNLYDVLFIEDSVTGNASGSYYFNIWESEEALCHNMDLLVEALEEFGCNLDYLELGAEYCDVTIRCYVLGQVIDKALEELKSEWN